MLSSLPGELRESTTGEVSMPFLFRLLNFLEKHSGLISAVGLVLAAIGVLLTLVYLRLYSSELADQRVEQERLAWERILRAMHQVAKFAAMAQLSSATHSPFLKKLGFVPLEIAEKYGSAQENLLNYWHQLKLELDIMPDSHLADTIQSFVAKYDSSADARATDAFSADIQPITRQVSLRAQKAFRTRKAEQS